MEQAGYELFRKVRRQISAEEISAIWGKCKSMVDRWCLPHGRETDTGEPNPLDKMKDMLDTLRRDQQYSIVSEIRDFLFPCGKLTVCGEPTTVVMEFTTASQESFVTFLKAIEDGKITDMEKKDILNHVGELEVAIEKIKAVLG